MRTKFTAMLLALACVAAIGAAAPAEAATLGHATLAGTLDLANIAAPAATDSPRFQVWNVGRRHRRRGRHHRRGHRGWFGFAPLLGLALSQSYRASPPPPPAPAWRFDGYRWVCDYVDVTGRPLCR